MLLEQSLTPAPRTGAAQIGEMNVAGKTRAKPYAKPVLQKRHRLTDMAEGGNVVVTGVLIKGGCFSNKR
jgi:hypothetical protein